MIRNNDMNIATPSIVSFTTDGRRFGQAASNTMSSSVMSFSNLIDLCENVTGFLKIEKVEGRCRPHTNCWNVSGTHFERKGDEG